MPVNANIYRIRNGNETLIASGVSTPYDASADDIQEGDEIVVELANGAQRTTVQIPPSITSVSLTNDGSDNLALSFDSDETLSTLSVTVDGPSTTDVYSFSLSDFSESTLTYTLSTTQAYSDGDGTYTATVDSAVDASGNDGATGESDSYTLDTTAPTISNFTASNPSGQDVQVSFDSDEQLGSNAGDIDVSISGAESASLARGDFTESGTGPYTYTATYAGSTDGDYTASLNTAKDTDGNDGASGESGSVIISATSSTLTKGGYSILNAQSVSDTEVQLQTSNVDGASEYEFQRADDYEFTSGVTTVNQGTSQTVTDGGHTAGDVYYYRCRAIGDGQEAWSLPRKVTVGAPEFPADTYSPTTGMSLQKLSSGYTGSAIRAKRVSDGQTQDFGFANHVLDIEALEDFSNGGDVVVTRIYDQIESGHYEANGDFPLPKVVKNGRALLNERIGRPYLDMAGDGTGLNRTFKRASDLSTSITVKGSMPMLCVDVRESLSGDRNDGWGKPYTGGTINNGTFASRFGNFKVKNVDDIEGAGSTKPTRQRTWNGGIFRASEQEQFIGPASRGLGSNDNTGITYSRPAILASQSYRFSEALIFEGVSTQSEYQQRLWSADDRWKAAPTETQYNNRSYYDCRFRHQGELIDWLQSQTRADMVLYEVTSVGASQFTVDADWGHLQSGDTVYADDQVFTLSGAPTVNGGETTLPTNESTSNVEVGDEALYRPVYDQTVNDNEKVANNLIKTNLSGDSEPNPGISGRAEAGWYANDTGEPIINETWSDWAQVDESQPDLENSQPTELRLKNDTSNRIIGFAKVPISNLTQLPSLVINSPYIDRLGTDGSDGKPYFGIKVFQDTSWDSSTLDWNQATNLFNVDANYDDIEGLDPGEVGARTNLGTTSSFRDAYNAGESAVTLMFYKVEDQWGSGDAARSVYLDGPNDTNPPENDLYQARGMTATNTLRVPQSYDSARVFGGGRAIAFWADVDLEYNGGQGNPYYNKDAAVRRGTAVDLANLINLHTEGNQYNWTRYPGGHVSCLADDLRYTPDVLGGEKREWVRELLGHIMETGRIGYDAGDNSNLDLKMLEGGMAAWARTEPIENELREQIEQACRKTVFNDLEGDPTTDEGLYHQEGNFYEGETPEGSYNNLSVSHLARGRSLVWDKPEWEWIDVMLNQCAEFFSRQVVRNKDGSYLDASGHSGRTVDAFLGGQWRNEAKKILALYDKGQHLIQYGGSIGDPSGVASNLANTLDAQEDFEVLRDVPPRWRAKSSWQTVVGHSLPSGWYSTLRDRINNGGGDNYPPFDPNSNDANFVEGRPSEDGTEDHFCFKIGSNGEFGGWIDVRRKSGFYASANGGTHLLGNFNYGAITSSRRPGSAADDLRKDLVEGVVGVNSDDASYGFHTNDDNEAANTVSVDTNARTARHAIEYNLGETHAPVASDASFEQDITYTLLSEADGDSQTGIEFDVTVNYSAGSGGADQVKSMDWQIPLARNAPSVEFQYWDGSAWVVISENVPVMAQEIRVVQEYSSGNEFIWLRTPTDQEWILRPEQSVDATDAQRLQLRLFGDGSTAQDIPSSVNAKVTVTNTDPGFTGTAISSSFENPAPDAVYPDTGLWAMKTDHSIPAGKSLNKLWYQYSEDNGSTWTTVASLDVGNAQKASGFGDESSGGLITSNADTTYQFAGDPFPIPSGLTNLRVRTEADNGDVRTFDLSVTADTPTVDLEEDFTASDGTSLDVGYSLDTGGQIENANSPPKVLNNKMVGDPNNGGRQAWWTTIDSTRMTGSFDATGVGNGRGGLAALIGNYFTLTRIGFNGGDLSISRQGQTEEDLELNESFNNDPAETYTVEAQVMQPSNIAVASAFDSDDNLVARVAMFDAPLQNITGAGARNRWGTEALEFDNLVVNTY